MGYYRQPGRYCVNKAADAVFAAICRHPTQRTANPHLASVSCLDTMFPMRDSPTTPSVESMIGANIRKIRMDQDLTVTQLARKASLTKGALSKIETGQTSASIATLMRIADALGMALADLLAQPRSQPPLTVTRHGQGHILTRDGSKFGYAYEGLALERRDKTCEPFLLTIQPEDPVGTFRHGGEEFIFMLEGQLELAVGDQTVVLQPGDSAYFNPSHEHTTHVLGDKTVRYLNLFVQDQGRIKQTRRGRKT